jgi:hypothetical protein
MPSTAQRSELAALMDWLHEERARIHYPRDDIRVETVHQIRSVADVKARVLRRHGWTVDCSQMDEALLRAVGLHLPFTDGATGSFLDNLPHYHDAREAYIGALAVFGPGSGHHMGMVRHRDVIHGNPVLFSHGQESDPRYISLLSEAAFQPAPWTMLSIAHLT